MGLKDLIFIDYPGVKTVAGVALIVGGSLVMAPSIYHDIENRPTMPQILIDQNNLEREVRREKYNNMDNASLRQHQIDIDKLISMRSNEEIQKTRREYRALINEHDSKYDSYTIGGSLIAISGVFLAFIGVMGLSDRAYFRKYNIQTSHPSHP